MGRKNIIIQIGDLDLDHDQEYFEEHLHTKNEIEEVKNELTQIANPIEKIDNESIFQQDLIEEQIVTASALRPRCQEFPFQQDLIEEQIVTVEKPTKNSKKKNTNQESSS